MFFFSVLFHRVAFQFLHSSHLSSSWKLFLPLLESALNDKFKNYKKCKNYLIFFRKITSHFSCCSSVALATFISLPHSLHSHSCITSLPPSFSLCLLPWLGSCDLDSLHQLMGKELKWYPLVDALLPWLPDNVQQKGGLDEGMWAMGVVTSLCLLIHWMKTW